MKFKKWLILFSCLAVVGIAAVICVVVKVNMAPAKTLPHAKISYYAKSSDALIKDSPCIIVAHVTGNQTQFKYLDTDFVKTQVEVEKALKGSELSGKEITLLQTLCYEEPIVEKDSTVLLFLDHYAGPVMENAYVCMGLYQGEYKIVGNKVIPSTNDKTANLVSDITQLETLKNLENKVSAISTNTKS